MKLSHLCLSLSFAAFAGCADAGAPPDLTTASLTAEQCDYFDVNGKVTICHATSSQTNPYVIIRTSVQGCINGHEDHANDFVAFDGVCVEGCYPKGAPVGAGDKCCEGLEAVDGVCAEVADTCFEKANDVAGEAYAKYCQPSPAKCDAPAAEKAATDAFAAYWKENCVAPCIEACKEDPKCKEECIYQSWSNHPAE